jgi:hypothetical protein
MEAPEIHALLIERFTSDAAALRARAEAPTRPTAGPGAALSRTMAEACDAVAALVREAPATREALQALEPVFAARAATAPGATQAVWRGAASRVRELLTLAEA